MRHLFLLFVFSQFQFSAVASDWSWLLEKKPQDSNEFVWDKRSAIVFKKIVPNIKISKNAAQDLAGIVRLDIMLPEPKKINDQRDVIFSGERPHDASTRGLLWIDTKNETGAFAINECLVGKSSDSCVTLGSRFFAPTAVPAAFISELKLWLKNEDSSLELRYRS
jgi:hypothetical protein